MIIAVPMSGGRFSSHFGQAHAFRLFQADPAASKIVRFSDVAVPDGGGCAVIPSLLANNGVGVVLASGMGMGAQTKLAQHNIKVVVGVSGEDPQQIVMDYLTGHLVASGEFCSHHGEGHESSSDCHRHGSE